MGDSKFLGSVFHYMEKGFEFQVTFSCKEITDEDLGIKLAKVENIKVKDSSGEDRSFMVDMEKVHNECMERAIKIISIHTPPKI
ncbi:hypothetical protein [Mongoliitalea daihaiensis]|uniref:hypothetical protein n=1 Tax=Mongoliitalea daihaiensis TaxID=2782006 RepID=UPI001F3EA0B7|nr:hypothetical protein [Mongoliitalea daihaiensis]UJP64054.1 hypothetical protein IPZ59_14670 [Mongoliitalea daihaiensis]